MAKLRLEAHEAHSRPHQSDELAKNSEVQCNQGLVR